MILCTGLMSIAPISPTALRLCSRRRISSKYDFISVFSLYCIKIKKTLNNLIGIIQL